MWQYGIFISCLKMQNFTLLGIIKGNMIPNRIIFNLMFSLFILCVSLRICLVDIHRFVVLDNLFFRTEQNIVRSSYLKNMLVYTK